MNGRQALTSLKNLGTHSGEIIFRSKLYEMGIVKGIIFTEWLKSIIYPS